MFICLEKLSKGKLDHVGMPVQEELMINIDSIQTFSKTIMYHVRGGKGKYGPRWVKYPDDDDLVVSSRMFYELIFTRDTTGETATIELSESQYLKIKKLLCGENNVNV